MFLLQENLEQKHKNVVMFISIIHKNKVFETVWLPPHAIPETNRVAITLLYTGTLEHAVLSTRDGALIAHTAQRTWQ